MRITSLLVVLVAHGFFMSEAQAQVYSFETYGKELDRAKSVTSMPGGFGQFGGIVDFNSGSVQFKKTLIELAGNNSLRVAADFVYQPWDRIGWPPAYEWKRDLPYIMGIHSVEKSSKGWVVGNLNAYTTQRCSDPAGVAYTVRSSKPPQDNFLAEDYWDGNSLVGVEGGGIIRPLDGSEPTIPGVNVRKATNGGWRFSCYSLTDGSEGFIGHSPTGEKYYFGIPEVSDDILDIKSNFHYDANTWLEVGLYKMHLTRIEDRFGNWVNYDSNQIVSSDGRTITFENTSNGMLVRANGRTWTITAGPTVTNPDGSVWSISKTGKISNVQSGGKNLCITQQSIPMGYTGQEVITITLESGAKGVFTLQPKRHGYSNVGYDCRSITTAGPRYTETPNFVDEISLVSRSVQGPGIQPIQHTIDYGSINACYLPVTGVVVPDVCTGNSPTTRAVTVTGSDGRVDRYVFGNKLRINSGLLISKNINNVSTESFEHELPYINGSGIGKRKAYSVGETAVVVMKQKVINQDGRNFTWKIASNCGANTNNLCIDDYFRPTKVIKSSGP